MLKKIILLILHSTKRVISKFFKDSCLVRASGLAYSSLLAMVPFITIVYAFGGFDTLGKSIESALLETIIPTQHEAFSQAINSFTRNSLATGTFGMIFFLGTSIFLINTIARNFDYIWGVQVQSNPLRRYATYTAILVFGSLLLGVSTSLTEVAEGYISSLGFGEVDDYKKNFSFMIPYLLSLSIFFIMLVVIPSVKVKLKPAIIGALISSILFEAIKIFFKFWVAKSVRNSLIYGSLSIIPIFLFGLYLFWIIVLIGTEITFHLQHKKDPINGNPDELNMHEKLLVGIELFKVVAKSYVEKGGGITIKDIEKRVQQSTFVINHFLDLFKESGLILKVDNKGMSFIPGKSLDMIYLKDIVGTIYGEKCRVVLDSNLSTVNSTSFSKGGFEALNQESLLELVKKL